MSTQPSKTGKPTLLSPPICPNSHSHSIRFSMFRVHPPEKNTKTGRSGLGHNWAPTQFRVGRAALSLYLERAARHLFLGQVMLIWVGGRGMDGSDFSPDRRRFFIWPQGKGWTREEGEEGEEYFPLPLWLLDRGGRAGGWHERAGNQSMEPPNPCPFLPRSKKVPLSNTIPYFFLLLPSLDEAPS